ncbi:PH domain-containing protein [Alteromonas oceanisediminis]|uniref:PH domain-containing protein n=1 Tax=Alteromonas oceanisediminis TaxID=2836180 RepID=UPI001BDB1201|nr:PH domain-containing protein [Alteromonas oceanisediminis]MBT0588085.1 PH domain-containing protein [Alteromonas oceanisediminis]
MNSTDKEQESIADRYTLDELELQPLASHYRHIRCALGSVMGAVIIGIAWFTAYFTEVELPQPFRVWETELFIGVSLLIALVIFYRWLADGHKRYAVRSADISYQHGLLSRSLISQPASRIQHIEVSQGPVDRIANLAQLHVYSAGSALQTFSIPGLPTPVAHELRSRLLAQTDNPDD